MQKGDKLYMLDNKKSLVLIGENLEKNFIFETKFHFFKQLDKYTKGLIVEYTFGYKKKLER